MNKWWYIAGGLGLLMALGVFSKKEEIERMAKSYLGRTDLPRGIRNNNPGNLIKTSIGWFGKIPHDKNTDSRFEQFESIPYGIRAMLKDIKSDITGKGQNTIRKLIGAYAPEFENNTTSYINNVAASVGISADAVLTPNNETLKKLGMAIIKSENGASVYNYIDSTDFDAALLLM